MARHAADLGAAPEKRSHRGFNNRFNVGRTAQRVWDHSRGAHDHGTNSPAQIALLDPSAMLNSNSGPKFDLDVSEQAAFQFYSAPAEPTAAATIVHSVYQRDLIAIKALRWSARLNPSPTRPRVL